MQLDNGTLALVGVLCVLGFLVWAGRLRPLPPVVVAPSVPPDEMRGRLDSQDTQLVTHGRQLEAVERELKELRRSVVRANAQAEEAKKLAESLGPILATILLRLDAVRDDLTIIKAAQAGADAAERAYNQQRRTGDTINLSQVQPGTQFTGPTTTGPVAGGNIGTIGSIHPTKPSERPHTI